MIKRIIKKLIYRLRGEYTTEALIARGLSVGSNFRRLNGVILDPAHCWLISIGDNVTMAPNVHVLAHDASTKNFIGYTKIGKVKIGNSVFIGANTVILPNISIGSNVIVGAGSVVTKDIPSDSVVAGNPAKFICTISEYIEKNKMQLRKSIVYDEKYTTRQNISKAKKQQMIGELENKNGYII